MQQGFLVSRVGKIIPAILSIMLFSNSQNFAYIYSPQKCTYYSLCMAHYSHMFEVEGWYPKKGIILQVQIILNIGTYEFNLKGCAISDIPLLISSYFRWILGEGWLVLEEGVRLSILTRPRPLYSFNNNSSFNSSNSNWDRQLNLVSEVCVCVREKKRERERERERESWESNITGPVSIKIDLAISTWLLDYQNGPIF